MGRNLGLLAHKPGLTVLIGVPPKTLRKAVPWKDALVYSTSAVCEHAGTPPGSQ